MRLPCSALFVLAPLLAAPPALAQTLPAGTPIVVIAVPLTQYPALGAQIVDGASAALAASGARPLVLDAPCDPVMAAPVAAEVAALSPLAVIGLPCGEALEAFSASFAPLATPLVTVGSRAPLRSAGGNILRVGPREADEQEAVAAFLTARWRETPFAILDDGSVHARALAEGLRNSAELEGLKPVLVEEFRPGEERHTATLRRLAAAGARAAFIAGDGEDVARIAAEARSAGIVFTLAGTESMLHGASGAAWPEGTLAIVPSRSVAPADIARLKASRSLPFAEAEGYVADAHAAAEVAMSLAANPAALDFQTILGALTRNEDGFLDPSGFTLVEMRGGGFVPASQ